MNCFHRWKTDWLKSTRTRRSSITALFILKYAASHASSLRKEEKKKESKKGST